jgi:hypothetical protein
MGLAQQMVSGVRTEYETEHDHGVDSARTPMGSPPTAAYVAPMFQNRMRLGVDVEDDAIDISRLSQLASHEWGASDSSLTPSHNQSATLGGGVQDSCNESGVLSSRSQLPSQLALTGRGGLGRIGLQARTLPPHLQAIRPPQAPATRPQSTTSTQVQREIEK